MTDNGVRPRLTVGFLPWWPGNPYQLMLKQELNERGVRVIGDPPLSLLRILVGRDGLDVVHVHWPHGTYKTPGRMAYMLCVLLMYRLLRNNIVWTVHELTAYESQNPRRDAWFRSMVMKLSRTLIVHGEYTKRLVCKSHGYRRAVQVAHHPSYLGWYKDTVTRDEARRNLGVGTNALVFLYFGYIKPYKGVEDLISAFRKLPGADRVLFIVGKPLDAAIKEQVEGAAAADPRIRTHLTYIADDEIQNYFRAADIVVFPFRETQTSGSLMLALTFGRAVIAPKIATLAEYVDASMGVLYDPEVPEALESALQTATHSPLETMGASALQRASDLDWGQMAARHLDVYQEIVGNTSP